MTISSESPAFERYNPPVDKTVVVAPRPLAGNELSHWLAKEADCQIEAVDEALWHGGIWLDRARLSGWPKSVAAGAQVSLFRFVRPPEVVSISDDNVLFADDAWVVVNKPAWLPVQGTRASSRISLETQLRALVGCPWLAPVHRLDRQTSGVIVFAKSPAAFEQAAGQFRRRTVEKRYLARVEQLPVEHRFKVQGYVHRSHHASHTRFEFVEHDSDGGRFTETEFVVRENQTVEAKPITGRTHQIRIHLAAVNAPIAGDTLYGGPWSDGDAQRVLLHAWTIGLQLAEKKRVFEAALPADFAHGRLN